jgi:lipopolysaccharide/colanic/teichoic acid biosynthesis glycosyltransferase
MINTTQRLVAGNLTRQVHSSQDGPTHVEVVVPEYFARKAIWMRLVAGLLLVAFSPIILLCMLLVRLTSPGPALFRQTRLGKNGKQFGIFKIRTMYCDAEDLSGPVLCRPGDSRITPIGRLMRFLHLDELPQLINVVRGEMCLVGPRPERPAIIASHRLNEIVPGFAERTKVLPGVTGLAQINLPADQTAACFIPKVQLDLEYIATSSANLDLRILLCTAMRMLGVRHGRAVRLFGLIRLAPADPASLDGQRRDPGRVDGEFNGQHSSTVTNPATAMHVAGNGDYEDATLPTDSMTMDCHQGIAVDSLGHLPVTGWSTRKPR